MVDDCILRNRVKGGKTMDSADCYGKNNRPILGTIVLYAFAHGGLDKGQPFGSRLGWGFLLLGECERQKGDQNG